MPTPQPATTDTTAPPTEREVFPIYISVVTDGPIPGRNNLLALRAEFSPTMKWERNILPQNGRIRPAARLSQDIVSSLSTDAVPVETAMREFSEWLTRFHGARLPVTSAVAFWHLVYHMSEFTEKLPFLANPIDVNSFHAGAHGNLKATRLVKGKDPDKALTQRKKIVEEAIAKSQDMNFW